MLAADANVVQKIVDLAPVQTFSLTDALGVSTTYTSQPVHEVKAEAPELLSTLEVHTLLGFGELVNQQIDGIDLDKWIIRVKDEKTVLLSARDTDKYGRRDLLVKATPVEFVTFRFGNWLSQEEFIIGVSALFAGGGDGNDKEYVLRIASTLTSEAVGTSEDNGFAQKATVKAGLKVQEIEVLKPQVTLAPFRTFPEVGQPMSAFVFRARQTDHGPVLMLIEADGGKWKLDAINEVRRYLATLDLKVPIIA
jgi:hypothetical protein